ncbi:MFS general substrate transporter [Epithele typhae]|uniref:MFS general substrate transporter n=1 Tax=Epithele typhae TaxID=378194 RepID=UPI0020086C63|nr:MFS general substrate transporter [Epithele typhae]KAH9917676.1 MFS general substrate transporter [Epithele typhae]
MSASSESPRKTSSQGHDDAPSFVPDQEKSFVEDHVDGDDNVWYKLDLVVLPVVTIMFFLSNLDRSNIGNASIAGLLTALKMTPRQYSIALTTTLVPYALVNFGTNLLMKIIGPRVMLPTLCILWGLVATLQGVVTSYSGLLACRFFLGLFEGGLLPGITLYLSSFYPRRRLQARASVVLSSVTLASAFSGLLAAALIKLHGMGGRPGWAWLFIIEGVISIGFGLLSYFLLPSSPTDIFLLTEQDKKYIAQELHKDGIILAEERDLKYTKAEVFRTFMRPHVWIVTLAGFFNGSSVGALGYFLPQIIVGLGWTGSKAQLMTVPPFAVAAFLAITASILSDKFARRGLTMIGFGTLATIGFGIFTAKLPAHTLYGSLFLLTPGVFGIAPSLGTWLANNSAPLARRATAVSIGTIATNFGAIFSTWLFGTISPSPTYHTAKVTLLVFQIGTVLAAVANIFYLSAQNKRNERLQQEHGGSEPYKGEGSVMEAGDDSIWYKFVM